MSEKKTAITTGACRYCGQFLSLPQEYASHEAADDAATELCGCDKATAERERVKRISNAQLRIEQLFGKSAAMYHFAPIDNPAALDFLKFLVDQVEDGLFEKAAITLYGSCKAEISTTSKGFIRIKRSETKTGQTEI